MTTDGAQSTVTGSALVVGGVYAYRKLVESSGSAPAAPVSHFVIGFGFVFLTVSVIAQAAPSLGAMLAILIAVGDVVASGTDLASKLSGTLKATQTATK